MSFDHAPFAQACANAKTVFHLGAQKEEFAGALGVPCKEFSGDAQLAPPEGAEAIQLFDAFENSANSKRDAFFESAIAQLVENGILIVREHLDPARDRTLEAAHASLRALGMRIIGAGFEDDVKQRFYVIGRKPIVPVDPKIARRQPRNDHPHVVIEGEVFTLNSSAIVNRNLALALADNPRFRLSIVATEPQSYLEPQERARFEKLDALRVTKPQPADVYIRYPWPPYFARPNARRYVHMQPWEFGSLPRAWREGLQANVDEIWCTSHYVREIYLTAGFSASQLAIVPHGIDPLIFTPEGPRAQLPTGKRFKFLFVGGTIERKGIDVLLLAYGQAFTREDDVCLVIKDFGSRGGYATMSYRSMIEQLRANPNYPEVVLIDEDLAETTLAALYRSCDVYVHPYRGEGFGLPVLEAMACGMLAVVTAGGATDDFTTEQTAVRVPAPRRSTGTHAHGFDLIAEGWEFNPQPQAWMQILRKLYERPRAVEEIGRAAAADVRARYTWEMAAVRAAARILRLVDADVPEQPEVLFGE